MITGIPPLRGSWRAVADLPPRLREAYIAGALDTGCLTQAEMTRFNEEFAKARTARQKRKLTKRIIDRIQKRAKRKGLIL